MPAEFRAQKGQVVVVDCMLFDRKPVGFEQVGWMMNGDACVLVETWKEGDEWVKGRRQLNFDKPGEFCCPIERWPAQGCCLGEEHVKMQARLRQWSLLICSWLISQVPFAVSTLSGLIEHTLFKLFFKV